MAKLDVKTELESVINNSPAVVFLCKTEEGWPVEFVSDNVVKLGYSVEDFESGCVKYADIIHPDDLEYVNSEVVKNSEEGNTEYT
ncbi:sensory transduction histidine kinase [Methanococcoides methylutens MM1]|uniref:histidine kinase n=1 Tax=Methanococcoides methylutens MM1 TaxID=1434104 RepID=A0A0E3STG2_METMT|nr:PAS domain-containing protein [Methanococcoides methylutens]AKB86098.1 sensory transduction histidine kinase [Methanococcoides methylutens MM1]